MMNTINIFLASSNELADDRKEFELFISRKNEFWNNRNISIKVINWENSEDAMSQTRSQDEYNKRITECDIFVMLFYTKVGSYTEEEFDVAVSQFQQTKKPSIFTYEKVKTDVIIYDESLIIFKKKLKEKFQHYYREYKNSIDLHNLFYHQLEKLYLHASAGLSDQLPKGFFNLNKPAELKESSEKVKYIDYLQSNNLPYISRDYFKKNDKEAGDIITESSVYEEFLNGSLFEGCIIYGPGGVGKTRLMLEIGQLALARGWCVIRVFSDAEAIEDLKLLLSPTERYVLLFDYIEESKIFNSEVISRLVEGKNITVKVIANCRFTYLHSPNFPSQSSYLKVELNEKKEQRYYRYVTNNILAQVKKGLNIINENFFDIKPSFAVFLKFLMYSNKVNTEDIREVGDFKSWIKKRLRFTFSTLQFDSTDYDRFYLLGILPVQNEKIDILNTSNLKKYLDNLQSDGWIEQITLGENRILRVIHDTITDEILIIHLEKFRTDASFLGEIEAFLKFSIKLSSTINWLRSLERISNQQIEDRKHLFFELFKKYVKNEPEDIADLKYAMTTTPLLKEEDRVNLFISYPDFFVECIENIAFGLSLSYAINIASKQKITEKFKYELRSLFDTWHNSNKEFITNYNIAYRILSTYTKLFGIDDFANSNIKTYLKNFNLGKETSYVIAAYLNSRGDAADIRPYILAYLQKYVEEEEEESSFVIIAWLNTKSNDYAIRFYALQYLGKYAEGVRAGYVIIRWLECQSDIGAIEIYIQSYLDNHVETVEANIIIQKCLEIKGKTAAIKPQVLRHLERNSEGITASFVIQKWIDNSEEAEAVRPYMVKYLEKNAEEEAAGFVIRKWLEVKMETETVKPYVIRFLQKNAEGSGARLILQHWMDSKGDLDIIKPYLLTHLKNNAEEVETSFIIQKWLTQKGGIMTIGSYMLRYLDKNAETLEANSVIQKWIDNKGSLDVIKPYLLRHLEKNAEGEGAFYILQKWLKYNTDINAVEPYMIRYFDKNPEKEGATFMLKKLLHYAVNDGIKRLFICPYLNLHAEELDAGYVMQKWLDIQKDEIEVIKPYLLRYLNRNSEQKDTGFVLQKWMSVNGEVDTITPYILHYLSKNAEQIESGFVLQKWLDNKGDINVIKPYLLRYLDKNAESIKANAVIQRCLDKIDDIDTIKSYTLRYLEGNAELPEACFVLQKWMDNNWKVNVIKPHILRYLEMNAEEARAGFVLQKWIGSGGYIDTIKPYILRHLEKNAEELWSAYFIIRLTDREDTNVIKPFMLRYLEKNAELKVASFILQKWIDKGGAIDIIKPYMHRHVDNKE